MNILDERELRLTGPGGPFELVDRGSTNSPFPVYATTPKTLCDVFRRAVGAFSARPLVADGHRSLSYSELFEAAKLLSYALRSAPPFRKGVRVALAVDDQVERLIGFVAIVAAGGVCTSLNLQEDALRLAHGIRNVRCHIAVVDALGAAIVETVAPDIARIRVNGAVRRSNVEPSAEQDWLAEASPLDEVLVAFTSGSTGLPKAALLDHQGVVCGLKNMLLGGALASLRQSQGASAASTRPSAPCVLVTGSPSHVSGHVQFLLMLMLGGKVVLGGYPAAELAATVHREKVRSISGVSAQLVRELLLRPALHDQLDSLATISLHGDRLSPRLVRELREALPHVALGTSYGLTETNGAVAVATTCDLEARPQSSGRLLPIVQVRVLDQHGLEQGPGCAGTIWLKGPMLMMGYLGAEGEAVGISDDGWFPTGDRGWVDEDRFIYLTDRSEVPMQGALERAAEEHPAVADAVAVLRPHHSGEPGIVLYCTLRPDQSCSRGDIVALIKEGLTTSYSEVDVTFITHLPRTASGKIDRTALQKQLSSA